ncbi:MAG: YebC/PmpR family DNA-binding transcriptional regulator [Dehalococcoidales bacterium]|nr:YebC/PmpR family DNA-binding transcriptional regulator [Dehalococcoidales bacterium]
MSGHNKWSKIKNKKGADDVKKGNLYTKLTREIIISAKEGGGNTESNFRLRLAIQKARDSNMPMDNIDRAIAKGTGTGESGSFEELTLEGYGPNGVAIMVSAMTDNRNRTVQEVRSSFTKHGGAMGENGCVAYMFKSRGVITVNTEGANTDDLELAAIDAGAEDVNTGGGIMEVYTRPDTMEKVRAALEAAKLKVESSEIQMVPETLVTLDEKGATQALKLIDRLEELDDVQNVYSNVDIPDSVMAAIQAAS